MRARLDPQLVRAFYRAALFLKARIEHDGWGWSSNYLREHVRCAYGLKFTNSKSPEVLRAVMRQYPELATLIKIKPRKENLLTLFEDMPTELRKELGQ